MTDQWPPPARLDRDAFYNTANPPHRPPMTFGADPMKQLPRRLREAVRDGKITYEYAEELAEFIPARKPVTWQTVLGSILGVLLLTMFSLAVVAIIVWLIRIIVG